MQALPEIQLNVGISWGRFPDSSESRNQNAPNLLGMNMNEHLPICIFACSIIGKNKTSINVIYRVINLIRSHPSPQKKQINKSKPFHGMPTLS